MPNLSYEDLKQAVAGNDAAFRLTEKLQPAGGRGSKVYPPTHAGGVYAWEQRRIGVDELLPTVLLDSAQSQANRLEQALLKAHRAGLLPLPIIQSDFSEPFPDIGMITTYDAPHRMADAIFRDSLLDGVRFRDSEIGKAFEQANIRNASCLFQYCPHALVFGMWDSTGSVGGLGNKFQRSVVSEIVGINAEAGLHTSSRIDPLGIRSLEIYESAEGGWTNDVSKAAKNKKGEPLKKKPSDFVHSNIPPTIKSRENSRDPLPGGVTIDYASLTSVISLPALRRLRFPLDGTESESVNNAARTVLAAMALSAIAAQHEGGYDLRSRCLLIPERDATIEKVANNGKTTQYDLEHAATLALYRQAVEDAKAAGLPWLDEPITLTPEDKLIDLVRRSRATATAITEE